MSINLSTLIDDAKCYQLIRQTRWTEGVRCPRCQSEQVVKNGRDETQPQRQRYCCKSCKAHFDDLSDTIFAGHHQPLQKWIGCLYLMGLNLSSEQIATELALDKDDIYQMTMQLRQGIVDNKPEVHLSGEVEFDEVYLTAGHKGQPHEVKKRGAKDGAISSKGFGDGGRLPKKSRRFSA
ncbi:transposase [Egbenema bharatensis]|uniref:transposase n=1 Tax=Egbenema bharatensis TaxID=3463334 RepID=UPI003A897AA3